MAMKNYKTKDVKPEDEQVKTKTLQSYHFPGEGTHKPVSIEAESREEAEKKYESLISKK